MAQYIRWLSELNKNSGQIAGGKGANLAEMFNSKFPVPPAFVITTQGYYHFIESTGIKEKISDILDKINVDDTEELEEKAQLIRKLIESVDFPEDLITEIVEAYENLSVDKHALEIASRYAQHILKNSTEPVFTAVRSSATTEDLDESSFAGQQESYLNIKGNHDLLDAARKVFASLFTARAIYYRKKRGFSAEKFALAVVVQKMIDSDKSGVIFTKNPIKNEDIILIEAVFGLGEGIVSGQIKPDDYEVTKDLEIVDKGIADKKIALVRDSQGNTETVKLSTDKSKSQVLEEREIKSLANYAVKIEEHYGKPQDIEFAIESGNIYIVQSRPITTTAKKESEAVKGKLLLGGLGASQGVASGKVKVIKSMNDLQKVQKGDILVAEMTNPDMVVAMQKSAGIITDEGGITSHAAIVSREMGIPAVVGTVHATRVLKDGEIVTVDGFNGKVFEGQAQAQQVEIKTIIPTKTKIKMILDLPDYAERAAKTGSDSIGLLRLEGIIASSGKHPIAYLKENKLEDYTKVLETGISKIAEHFKEIRIRTSDIRSDEFSNLEGAPKKLELNPMLGFHGIRFSLKNLGILKAELQAIKNCSKKFPNKQFEIMFPQIISIEEVIEVKKITEDLSMENIKLGIMVETPAACLIIKDLIRQGLDFISLGTNDLTQYTLAVDRGNEQVQYLYNETHPAVINEIKRVIRTCNEEGVESSICGQAGSNKEMVKHLIEFGISSISVNADAAYETSLLVSELEKNQTNKQDNKEPTNEKKEKIIISNKMPDVGMKMPVMMADNQDEKKKLAEQAEQEEKMRGYEDHLPSYTEATINIIDHFEQFHNIQNIIQEHQDNLNNSTNTNNINQILDIF